LIPTNSRDYFRKNHRDPKSEVARRSIHPVCSDLFTTLHRSNTNGRAVAIKNGVFTGI